MKKTRIIAAAITSLTALSLFSGMAFAEEETQANLAEGLVFEGPGIIDVMEIPEEYKNAIDNAGRVERIDYQNDYGNKYMYVYLPYGYDESDTVYNTYYLMHGGNGQPDIFLQTDHPVATQKMFDNAFATGDVEPFIIVSSSWNPAADDDGNPIADINNKGEDLTLAYVDELVKYIIPIVDGTYRTYAGATDTDSLIAARDHRAFGGFSMGGVTTWNVFANAMAYFKYFVPESGDCWAIASTGGKEYPAETAQYLADAAMNQGYTSDDFVIYAFTGSEDIAVPNLGPQILAMMDNEFFKPGENLFFGLLEGATHSEAGGKRYRYTASHYIWK